MTSIKNAIYPSLYIWVEQEINFAWDTFVASRLYFTNYLVNQ